MKPSYSVLQKRCTPLTQQILKSACGVDTIDIIILILHKTVCEKPQVTELMSGEEQSGSRAHPLHFQTTRINATSITRIKS